MTAIRRVIYHVVLKPLTKVLGLLLALDRWQLRASGTPRDALQLSYLARQEIGRREWDRAVFLGKRAIVAHPYTGDGHRMLGQAYLGTGDVARARSAYEEGVRLVPDDHRIAMELGALEFAQGRYTAAETAFRRALALRPEDPDVLYQVAGSVGLQGRYEETTRLLERARELAPDHAWVLARLGARRYAEGDAPGAVALLTEAIERERAQPSAHYYLALALSEMGRHEEGLAAARRAAALDPDDERFSDLQAELARKVNPFERDRNGPEASA